MAARMIEAVLCEKRSPTAGPASISRASRTGTQCADFERAAGAAMDYVIQVANADRAALGDGMGRVCSPSPVERWGRFIDDLDEVGAPDGSLQGNQATRVWFPINFGGAASTPGRTLSSATVHF
jgi:hypothetical protein